MQRQQQDVIIRRRAAAARPIRGPRVSEKGRRASSSASRRASASRSEGGWAASEITGSGWGAGGAMTWKGRPSTLWRVVRRIVPVDQPGAGRLERAHVERTPEAQGAGDVVDRAVGLELVEEPEALLREGERELCEPLCLGDAGGDRAGRGPRLPEQRDARPSGR